MKLSLRDVLDLRMAGAADDVSLLAAIGGGLLANPAFGSIPDARLLGAAITAGGVSALARRFAKLRSRGVFTSGVRLMSSTGNLVDDLSRDWKGVLLGYTVDTGRALVIPWEDWLGHTMVVGQSGMGKSVFGEWLTFQQIVRGGGVFTIDGKIDSDNIERLNLMAAFASRRSELRVVNPNDPSKSNTYSPVLYGDADEVSARVLSLIPSAENNPGADHYRQSANQGVTTTVNTIRASGNGYTFLDLSILLQSESAMEHLMTLVPPGSEARAMYRLFLERFMQHDNKGKMRLDMKKVSDLFGGVGGRLFSFGEGNFGKITNTYAPEINLYDDITSGRIVYVALPTMGKAETASQFGKMTVGDYRSVVARIQDLPKHLRPWPPTLDWFDEAGSYVTQAWSRIFEQSRTARQALLPAFQTIANLDAITKELREMVIGNTVTKVVFRLGTDETAQTIADLIGKEHVSSLSITAGGGAGGRAEAGTGAAKDVNKTQNMGYSERYEEVYRVPNEDLKALWRGEAVVLTNGGDVYHIKIPVLEFSDKFKEKVGPFEVNRVYKPFTPGLRLFEQFGKAAAA